MADHTEIDPERPETWPDSAREYLARQRPSPPGPRLQDQVRAEIRAGGPMTFARFMERALYDPECGYYAAAGQIGPRGDFVTSPTLHPAFGALLCRRLVQVWEQLGRPAPFCVAEAGAGTAELAAQILAASFSAPAAFADALRYRIIEPFPAWRAGQRSRLAPWIERVSWHEELEAQPHPPHLLLANELLDALPVHRVVRRAAGLRERFVSLDDHGELTETDGPLSTAELAACFDRLGLLPPPDTTVEVGLAAAQWLRRAMAATRGGWIWLLDYGASAPELYTSPRAGTLRAFHRHALSADPLARVGAQDLTADVDFTSLIRLAEAGGWTVEEFSTQRELLLSLGWRDWLHPGEGSGGCPPAATPSPGRWALAQLIDPHGLGALHSLLLTDGRLASG